MNLEPMTDAELEAAMARWTPDLKEATRERAGTMQFNASPSCRLDATPAQIAAHRLIANRAAFELMSRFAEARQDQLDLEGK